MLKMLSNMISHWENTAEIALVLKQDESVVEITYHGLFTKIQQYDTLMKSLNREVTLVLQCNYCHVDFIPVILAAMLNKWTVCVTPPICKIDNICVLDDEVVKRGYDGISEMLFKVSEIQAKFIPKQSIVYFTSGTTGIPKGIVHNYSSIILLSQTLGKLIKSNHIQSPTTFYYRKVYHLSFIMMVFGSLFSGSKCVYIDDQHENLFNDYFKKYKINIGWFIPSFAIVQKDLLLEYKDQIKLIMLGGEAISPKLLECLDSKTTNIYFGLGSTECPIITLSKYENKSQQFYLLGDPYLSELKVIDQRLAVKSDLLCQGFLDLNTLTYVPLSRDIEGFYQTDDRVELNDENQLFFLGRKSSNDKIIVYDKGNAHCVYETQIKIILDPYIQENYFIVFNEVDNTFNVAIEGMDMKSVPEKECIIKECIISKYGMNYFGKLLTCDKFSYNVFKINKIETLRRIGLTIKALS